MSRHLFVHSQGEDGKVRRISYDLYRMGAVGPALPDGRLLWKAKRKGAALCLKKKKKRERNRIFPTIRTASIQLVSCPHIHRALWNPLCSSLRQYGPGCFQKVCGCKIWGVRGKRHIQFYLKKRAS